MYSSILRTVPTFVSAHTFCASRKAWFKRHARARVDNDATNYVTKYTTKMKAKFSSVTKSSLMNLYLRWYGTLKYGDVHEKFNFLEIQDLRLLRTGQKHFETILPNFLPDECEI